MSLASDAFRLRRFGHTAQGILMNQSPHSKTHQMGTITPRGSAIQLLPSSHEDRGIHIADAAADSLVPRYLRFSTTLREVVQCDDIFCELLADGVWHWTNADTEEHTPILDEQMRHVNYCSLQSYSAKRDIFYREGAGLSLK